MAKQVESKKIELWSKDHIKSDQDGIRKSLVSLDAQIHTNAVQCLLHAETHGDTSLMRRLIVETLNAKNSGYRVQGLINWMRQHSPMELKGDTINLSGTDGKGHKRPFLVEKANATPFWTDARNNERVAKPAFQNTLISPIMNAHKQIMAAIENTVNGQPVDPSKPYFEGLHADKVVDFAKKVKELADQLPADNTAEVHKARARIAQDIEFVKANGGDSAEVAEGEISALSGVHNPAIEQEAKRA